MLHLKHVFMLYMNNIVADHPAHLMSLFFIRGELLALNAPSTTKVVCFSSLLKCLRSLYGKQCGPRSDCSYSGSMLFASILNLSVILGNYLQQMNSADDIFRCIFFLGALRVIIAITLSSVHPSSVHHQF